MATIIRVHVQDPRGGIRPEFEAYNLNDFGGHPPQIGDLILVGPARPGAAEGRTQVWEVCARYHDPGTPFDSDACLRIIVKARSPTADEHSM